MRLKNKVALITGAAGGQGKAEAELFAEEGAKVVITDINFKELQKTEDNIKKRGGDVLALQHDVSLEKDWEDTIQQTRDSFGKLDVLVNNAGILLRDGILITTLNDFSDIQSVNTIGTFLGIKHASNLMKATGGGSIINISSIYGLVGSAGSTAYHASKGAIRLMSKAAAIELSDHYIRVNSIHPGVIITSMSKEVMNSNNQHPLKDATPWPDLGEPKDIAYGALFLGSDESRFITGSELVIDGGYTAK
ncbi:MAG TPA: glucose 1-dehydrogenase [Virgibacillus sp.]|nr:glucose 1-dehydrogenase [Virgibacillus sp.]HLR67207.1 glucose 1-dehydrogenase [Virgibacillus sp.]